MTVNNFSSFTIMTEVTEKSFNLVLMLLRFAGLYSDGPKSRFRSLWSYLTYFLVTYNAVALLLNLFLIEETESQRNQAVLASFVMGAVPFKLLPFFLKGDQMKKCINYFGNDSFLSQNQTGKRIVEECVRICRRNEKLYWSGLLLAEAFWWSFTFFTSKQALPLSLWLPYDYKSSPNIFWLTYLGLSAVILYVNHLGQVMEPLIGGLVYHGTCQIRILKHNLQNLDEIAKSENGSFSQTLKHSIIHHRNILEFFKELQNCFSLGILSQIAGNTFGLCYCAIGLLTNSQKGTYSILYATDYVFLSFQIFLYCYLGTLLFEENEGLISAIYMSPWYNYDLNDKKLLITIMERSKRPIILSAGKIVNLTLRTFTSVLKTGYSLVAAINNF